MLSYPFVCLRLGGKAETFVAGWGWEVRGAGSYVRFRFGGRTGLVGLRLCRLVMSSSARQLPAQDSWIFCRKSAPKPEPRSALEPPGLTPFWRLFRFSASVDHQMTPPLFAGASRASRLRPAHWRSGCRARLRRPSDLKNHAACGLGGGLGLSFGKNAACPVGELRAEGIAAFPLPLLTIPPEPAKQESLLHD